MWLDFMPQKYKLRLTDTIIDSVVLMFTAQPDKSP
jgi:hypothetical protein